MTSDYDNIQLLIKHLKKNPDDEMGWIILMGIINGLHSFAHDIGDAKIKIEPKELQTAVFLQIYSHTKVWMKMLYDYLQRIRQGGEK